MTPLLLASGIAIPDRLAPTDLRVAPGTMTAVIGPNGGGKTSLLRALARIDHSGGAVWVEDEDVAQAPAIRRRRLLAFLPASRELPWPIAARDVIALGLAQPDPGRVDELVEAFGLAALVSRPADLLSTGERARVLLARAMAQDARVLLLDEPLSNLDPYWTLVILDRIRSATKRGAAAIVSLHDLHLLDHFDRALLVDRGRIQADDAPQAVMDDPKFGEHFGVVRDPTGWRIRPDRPADRRSSP